MLTTLLRALRPAILNWLAGKHVVAEGGHDMTDNEGATGHQKGRRRDMEVVGHRAESAMAGATARTYSFRASGSAWTARTLTLPDGRRLLAWPLLMLTERVVVRLPRGGVPPSPGATDVPRRRRLRGLKLQGAECRGWSRSAPKDCGAEKKEDAWNLCVCKECTGTGLGTASMQPG